MSWPQAYRRWLVQTIGFALSEGFANREAFWMSHRDVRAALEADRARVIAEAAEDGKAQGRPRQRARDPRQRCH